MQLETSLAYDYVGNSDERFLFSVQSTLETEVACHRTINQLIYIYIWIYAYELFSNCTRLILCELSS